MTRFLASLLLPASTVSISAAGLRDVLVSMWWGRAKRDREFWARKLRYAMRAVLDFGGAFPFEVPIGRGFTGRERGVGIDDAMRWQDLADRVRRGDSSAEEELSLHFHPRIVAMAVVRLRDPEAAREIAQDALLAVLVALREGKLREPEKLPAFVSGTARNLVNNHFRSLREQPNPVELDPETPSTVNLATEAELAEQRRTVRDALERIDSRDRVILLLTLVEGMNPREIAPRVGLSIENVRTRKMRAIRQVTEELQKLSRKKGQTPLSKETVS